MLVASFLSWMDEASPRERAEATAVLAETWLAGTCGEDGPQAVEAALTSVLDDGSPLVRRALAVAFADHRKSPRHLVLHLAADVPEVACPVISHSPVLTEADLVDLAGTVEARALAAIALRPDVTPAVAHAVVMRMQPEAAFALVGNGSSEIAEADLLALVARYGQSARFRNAVQARPGLPVTVRHALMLQTASALGSFVTGGGFLAAPRQARLVDETLQSGTVALARQSPAEMAAFVAHLRGTAQLTPSLLLRSVLGGDLSLMIHALANLCELPLARVQALLLGRSEPAIIVLLRRAGLPAFVETVMAAAITAAARLTPGERQREFALPVLLAAQQACLAVPGEDGVKLMAMLRRFEAQVRREESRAQTDGLRETLRRQRSEMLPLSLPGDAQDLLRLGGFDAEGEALAESIAEICPEAPAPNRRILRERGLVLDEPIPDLATIIAEWKAERAGNGALAQGFVPEQAETQTPGVSRAA